MDAQLTLEIHILIIMTKNLFIPIGIHPDFWICFNRGIAYLEIIEDLLNNRFRTYLNLSK